MSYNKEIILGVVSMFLRGSNLRISRSKSHRTDKEKWNIFQWK